jgi:glutamate synthase (NADPH/NADH) small chain
LQKQKPEERVQNWREVFMGFSADSAKIEASRCIQCPTAPCQSARPVHNDIPAALAKLERGDIIGASAVFRETSELPEMCGRLCPQEKLCEGECVVAFAIRPDKSLEPPVAIGKLEAFATDTQRKQTGLGLPNVEPKTGRRVAVIGAGPAGLAVAEGVMREGHACTAFDANPEPGGVLLYGIPSFKLPPDLLREKLDYLERLGIEFVANTRIGDDVTLDSLFDEMRFDAVFVGRGLRLAAGLRFRVKPSPASTRPQTSSFTPILQPGSDLPRWVSTLGSGSAWRSSGEVTPPWIAYAERSAWALDLSPAFTGAQRTRCLAAGRSVSTQPRKVLCSST